MMKTTVERIDDSTLKLAVEVPQETIKRAIDDTLVYMGQEMNVPGFRPGKVPPKAIMARLGKEAVLAEAVRFHIDHWYQSAVFSSGIRPIAAPEIDLPEDAKADADYSFTAKIEVVKRPDVPKISSIEVEKPVTKSFDKEIEKAIEDTLKGVGKLVDTGKPAEKGNDILLDFICKKDGEDLDGASATGYQARLGEGQLLDELDDAIVGHEAGTKFEVPVTFPEDHPMPQLAGNDVVFHVDLQEVQTLELPELDDKLASEVSEFATAKELREDIETKIKEKTESENKGLFRANAITALAEAVNPDIPEQMVQSRQQEMYNNLKQQIGQFGMTIEQFLSTSGKDSETLLSELEENAKDDIKRELSLLALAEEQSIKVDEEDLLKEIRETADGSGVSAEDFLKQIMESGRGDMLRGELLIQRTIDYLVDTVKAKEVDKSDS